MTKIRKNILLTTSVLLACVFSPQLFALELVSQETRTDIIELFTSEGCSSCPPADRWLSDLKQNPELFKSFIPLAFHVDYWDYLGWKDKFANPAYSKRQRLYVREGLVSQVYTPGFVVSSREWRGWFSGDRKWPLTTEPAGVLTAKLENEHLVVNYSDGDGQYLLNIAYLGLGLSSAVKSGENHGRLLAHDFVVLDLVRQPGKGRWETNLPPLPSAGQQQSAIAIWLSPQDSLQVIQAVGGYLEE